MSSRARAAWGPVTLSPCHPVTLAPCLLAWSARGVRGLCGIPAAPISMQKLRSSTRSSATGLPMSCSMNEPSRRRCAAWLGAGLGLAFGLGSGLGPGLGVGLGLRLGLGLGLRLGLGSGVGLGLGGQAPARPCRRRRRTTCARAMPWRSPYRGRRLVARPPWQASRRGAGARAPAACAG